MKIQIEESLTQTQLDEAKSIARILIANKLSTSNYFTFDKKRGELVNVKEFPVLWDLKQSGFKVKYNKKTDTFSIKDIRTKGKVDFFIYFEDK